VKQEHLETADLDQGKSGPDQELDDFQNLMRTSLSKGMLMLKFSWRYNHFFCDAWNANTD